MDVELFTAMVGFHYADHAADVNAPVSTAAQISLVAAAPVNNLSLVCTCVAVAKPMGGLGNADKATSARSKRAGAIQQTDLRSSCH